MNDIEYISPNTVILMLPFILTEDKILKIGMPYLFSEGIHSYAIRLIDVWDTDRFVYLKIQELQSSKGHVYLLVIGLQG